MRVDAFFYLCFDNFFIEFEIVVQEVLPVFFSKVCMDSKLSEEGEVLLTFAKILFVEVYQFTGSDGSHSAIASLIDDIFVVTVLLLE